MNTHCDRNNECLLSLENIKETSDDFCELDIQQTGKTFEDKQSLWIPSSRSQYALKMNIPYSHFLVTDLLTIPNICEEELSNRIKQLEATLGELGITTFGLPSTQLVSSNEYDLLELVQKEAFTSALIITARMLRMLNFGRSNEPRIHTPQSIQLWFTRLALLVKMQEFKIAEMEASPWGDCDKPDLYYQFYPDIYPGHCGSMVPFQMRLLLANFPSHCGRHSESLSKLFSILATTRRIQKSLKAELTSQLELNNFTDFTMAKRLWDAREKRVLISIVNAAVKDKDFILAIEIISSMIKNENTITKKQTLYSILGRVYLQFGDLVNAEKFFLMARSEDNKVFNNKNQDFQNIVDLGLLAVARNDFREGYQYFEKASFIDPCSLMVMNNCAICLSYLGHMREAIRLLTGAINNDPLHALHDSLVLNLCTMYELNSSHCKDKKVELLKLSVLFKGDIINLSSYRLF